MPISNRSTTTEQPWLEPTVEFADYSQYPGLYQALCHGEDTFTLLQIICRCVAMPLICFIGIFCNMVNVLVFSQKGMRKQTFNYFFLTLSLSDTVVLVSALMVFVLPAVAELMDMLHLINLSSQLVLVFYPIGQTALTSSVYLTVVIAFHRFIAIGHPFVAARYFYSRCFVLQCIAGVILFSLAFNAPRWFELRLSTCFNERHELNEIAIDPTELMLDRYYTVYYRNTAYSVIQFFLPFAALIFLNVSICMAVRRSQQFAASFTRENRSARGSSEGNSPRTGTPGVGTPRIERQRGRKQSRDINRMLTSIILFFLFFNILGLINNVMELSQLSIFGTFDTFLVELASICVDLNAASTSFNYWWYGSKYREVVKKFMYNTMGVQRCKPELIRPAEQTRIMVTRYHYSGYNRPMALTTAVLEENS